MSIADSCLRDLAGRHLTASVASPGRKKCSYNSDVRVSLARETALKAAGARSLWHGRISDGVAWQRYGVQTANTWMCFIVLDKNGLNLQQAAPDLRSY